jgi:hypothetical protein
MTDALSRQERRRLERLAKKAYLRQPYLVRQLADAKTFPRGRVTIANVYHDDWCPRLRGGLCRCDPEITYETLPPVEEGGDRW